MTANEMGHAAPKRASARTGALILNPSLHVSYETLRRWVESRPPMRIDVYGEQSLVPLQRLLIPRTVQAVNSGLGAVAPHSPRALARCLAALVNRYEWVVILCATDDEATTGQTVFRIIGETLLSDHVVLLGPQAARAWPGRSGVLAPKRLRELMTVASTAGLGLGMTAVALTAVAVEELAASLRRQA